MKEETKIEDNRKWAKIRRKGVEHDELQWVDNKTMKAYEREMYSPTWIEIPYFEFIRWGTTFVV